VLSVKGSVRRGEWKTFLPFSSIIFFLVFLDQASKILVKTMGGKTYCNRGVAFGFFPGESWTALVIMMIFFVLVAYKIADKILDSKIPMALILGGGISNLIDRGRLGCVMDFINLQVWPVFNAADVMVCAGVISLVFLSLKK